jgi:hypothetical protein
MVLKAFRTLRETFPFTEEDTEFEERALGTQNYLCVRPNEVSNGNFETDLTGWTESIGSGLTATTQRVTAESKTNFGSLASLEIDITASANAGSVTRSQIITGVSPGEVWNFEAWVKGSAYANAFTRMRIEFQDSGGVDTGVANTDSTDVGGEFVQLKLENQVAPAGTVKVNIRLQITVTTGGTGKAWFDLVRAEKGAAAISARARRIICGEWVCRA